MAEFAKVTCAAVMLAAVLAASGSARGDGAVAAPDERFGHAASAMAAGEHAAAAAAFLSLAEDAPEHALADDALFSAAKLIEERLADPARALAIYRRLLERYPSSRTALAAARRAEAIERDLGPGGGGAAALARFTDIVQHFSERGERASIALATALLAEHPEWPGRARALLWLAQVHQRAGRHEQALAFYLDSAAAAAAAAASASAAARSDALDDLFDAYRGAGDMAAHLGRFDEAERIYRRMPVTHDPARVRSLDDALVNLGRARLRAHLYVSSFVVIVLVCLGMVISLRAGAGSWRDAVRALRAPPMEAVYMAPVAAILTAAAYTGHESIGPAVTMVSAGGLILTWLSGTALAAGEPRGRWPGRSRVLAHAAAMVVAVVALCYIALHRNRLIDMIIDTVRFGPDV